MLKYLLIISFIIISQCIDDIFNNCDFNNDKLLSENELIKCSETIPLLKTLVSIDLKTFIKLLDKNKDNYISILEFSESTKTLTSLMKNDFIYQNYRGEQETINSQDLFDKIQKNSMNDFEYENGLLSKKIEDKVSVVELDKKNPELSNYVKIAKFAHQKLMEDNNAYGKLVSLKNFEVQDGNSTLNSNKLIFKKRHFEVLCKYFLVEEITYYYLYDRFSW